MRILAVNTFMSLDGVMQSPGGPDEDPTGGFHYGGWGVNYFDDEMMERMAESGSYELLLGRGTYEIFAAHWPYDEGPIADQLNGTRKHVASTTLKQVEWNNSTLITGDVADYVRALKAEDGPEIQVHGSPGLIQTLLRHDLIDQYRMWIFPLALGTGKRFFGDGTIPVGLSSSTARSRRAASPSTRTNEPARSAPAPSSSTSRPRRSWTAGAGLRPPDPPRHSRRHR
jgi:dihydrofolate reductase